MIIQNIQKTAFGNFLLMLYTLGLVVVAVGAGTVIGHIASWGVVAASLYLGFKYALRINTRFQLELALIFSGALYIVSFFSILFVQIAITDF